LAEQELDVIAEGLVEALALLPDIHAANGWPDEALPSRVAIVQPDAGDYEVALGDDDQGAWRYQVVLMFSSEGGRQRAQRELNTYLSRTGDRSVVRRLLADPTLDGRCDTLFVRGFVDYGQAAYEPGVEWWTAKVNVEVIT